MGLFRLTEDWEKLPVPTLHGIMSVAVAEDRLYVGTIASPPRGPHGPYAAVFYATDLGDLWIDITPDHDQYPFKLAVAVGVVPIGDVLMLVGARGVLLSHDGGETWMDPMSDSDMFSISFGAFHTVALDENTFYRILDHGIARSMDGGATWQPFTAGLVNSNVPSLVTVENVLYALTPMAIRKSADGGESWETIGLNAKENISLERVEPKVATANGALYASTSELEGVKLFHLSDDSNVFLPVEGVPDFEEDTLHVQWEKKLHRNGEEQWGC